MYDWIKTSDKLPENAPDVLLSYDGENICADTYYDKAKKRWIWIDSDNEEYPVKKNITHWFPFPNVPNHTKKAEIVSLNNEKSTESNHGLNCS